MDALKKFLNKKKADIKFKTAGPGQKLTTEPDSGRKLQSSAPGTSSGSRQQRGSGAGASSDQGRRVGTTPSEEKRQAAAAALARLEKQKKPESNEKDMLASRQLAFIKEQARREIEAEMKMKEVGLVPSSEEMLPAVVPDSATEKVVDPKAYAVSGVFFTCPLIGPEVSTKEEIEERIKEFLKDQPEEELAIMSCLIIHSCNKPREKVNTCVDILCKYLDNILNNPDNPKVRKIRFANKAYQDKIAVVEGSSEFLRAAGFTQTRLNNDDTGEAEDVWFFNVTSDELETSLALLTELRDTLKETTPIRPEIDRNVQILMPAQVKERKELPPEFYQITSEEIQREQRLRTEIMERELTLRTKAQREKDEMRDQRLYRYCVMRVRFPDGFTLQGTFGAHEKVSDLYDFVRQNLLVEDLTFVLKMPRGETLQTDDSSLSENRLPPASIVNFHVENPPQGITSGEVSYLKPEILALVKSME